MLGNSIHALCSRLFPINRSITGDGVRETLKVIKELLPNLKIHEIPSGERAFDWVVPKEWRVRDAYIITPQGKKICNFKINNLHLVGYSIPINKKMSLCDLQQHLYSLPKQPTAIPYVTSYYKEIWGFCLSQNERDLLQEGDYHVFIDADLFDGSLTYGELLIRGKSDKEIFLSTYVCHPSMANNELSGPAVTTHIAKWILEKNETKYSYRIIFIPETIGSIVYLSKNLATLKKQVYAGFNITCVGDNRNYSYLPSRHGATISDSVAQHVLKFICPTYKTYLWSDRGSDERQYCSPGVDLPIASIMRTKYGEYDEYHTSLDDLVNVVTPDGLEGATIAIMRALDALEKNCYPKTTVLCEPQLGRRGLYPTVSTKYRDLNVKLMMNLITWSDGTKSLLEIADLCQSPIWEIYPIINSLLSHELLELHDCPANLSV